MKKLRECIFLVICSVGVAQAANDWPDVPVPDGVQVEWAADAMVFNGVPMQIFSFDYLPGVKALLEFYDKEWTNEGTEFKQHKSNQWEILSAPHGEHYVTIQITDTGNGAYAQVGISNWGAVGDTLPELGKGFPRLPASRVMSDINAVDGGSRSRTLLIENGHSIASNFRYYLSHFSQQNWNVIQQTMDPRQTGALLSVNKGGRELELVVSRQGSKSHIVIVEVAR